VTTLSNLKKSWGMKDLSGGTANRPKTTCRLIFPPVRRFGTLLAVAVSIEYLGGEPLHKRRKLASSPLSLVLLLIALMASLSLPRARAQSIASFKVSQLESLMTWKVNDTNVGPGSGNMGTGTTGALNLLHTGSGQTNTLDVGFALPTGSSIKFVC